MNKTLSIGLAGFSFVIEEHAYIKLSDYLSALRSSLDSAEADEVMNDIETRIVEIFNESLGKREVVNNEDVEKVIKQIGSPEKIEEQEEAYFSDQVSSKKQNRSNNNTAQKQLFRDPEQAKIGGVCAGLAHYFGMDVTWMRVIWVLAFFALIPLPGTPGLIVIVYIILWAVLPKAQSVSDFLKMKGKPVNFDTIKEESNKIVQFANESAQRVGEMYNESKPIINSTSSGLWNVFRYFFGIVFAITAFLFFTGSFVVFGFMGNSNFPPINFMEFYFDDGGMKYVMMAIILLGCLIPATLFALLSIKLLSPKVRLRNTGWVLGGMFLALIGFASYFGFSMANEKMLLKGEKQENDELAINVASDTLFVDVKQIAIPQNFTGFEDDIYSDKKSVYKKDYIYVDVNRKQGIKTPYLIVKKNADGYNIPMDMEIPLEIAGNKVSFPNYIKYPYAHRFRDYDVDYELVVPENMVVIPLKDGGIHFNGDLNNNGVDDDEEDNGQDYDVKESAKININGTTIEYNSDDADSVIINGNKVPKAEADKILKKDISKIEDLEDLGKLKDVNISIKNGEKEISIKTD